MTVVSRRVDEGVDLGVVLVCISILVWISVFFKNISENLFRKFVLNNPYISELTLEFRIIRKFAVGRR